MSILIYWLEKPNPTAMFPNLQAPQAKGFEDAEFMVAMKFMEDLRRDGHRHVIMSNENADSVGKPGVDSVVDGKTPDGVPYTWTKQDRAGRMKRSDR
jgi:hypothetical protein